MILSLTLITTRRIKLTAPGLKGPVAWRWRRQLRSGWSKWYLESEEKNAKASIRIWGEGEFKDEVEVEPLYLLKKECTHLIKREPHYGACGKNLGHFTIWPEKVTCLTCRKTKFFAFRQEQFKQAEKKEK